MLAYSASHLPAGILAGLIVLGFVYRLLRPALIASTLSGITQRERRGIVRSAGWLLLQFLIAAALVLLACVWLSRSSPHAGHTQTESATYLQVELTMTLPRYVSAHAEIGNHPAGACDSS